MTELELMKEFFVKSFDERPGKEADFVAELFVLSKEEQQIAFNSYLEQKKLDLLLKESSLDQHYQALKQAELNQLEAQKTAIDNVLTKK